MFLNVPKYLLAMTAVTGIYLTVELPFTVHLVRLLGGLPTQADIDAVEGFGRVLTGIAVALAWVGMRTFPLRHARGRSFSSSVAHAAARFALIVPAVYFALHFYGEARGYFASGETRKEAFVANLAKRALSERGIDGFAPSDDPSWLALVSGLPAMYSSDRLVAMTGESLGQLAALEAARSLGTPEQAREAFAGTVRAAASDAYEAYREGVDRYRSAVSDVDFLAEDKWNEYRQRLAMRFAALPRPGEQSHRAVVQRLRAEGIEVGDRFRLDDKTAFVAAVRKSIVREARARFAREVASSAGTVSRLVPGMDERAFFADPGIQTAMHEKLADLRIPSSVGISPFMDLGVFKRSVMPSLIDRATADIISTATSDASSFTFGARGEVGRRAAMAATLPATALLLSLAGALFHIYKVSGFAVAVFGRAARSAWLSSSRTKHAFAAAVLVLALIGMRPGVPAGIERIVGSSDAGVYAAVVGRAVEMQPGVFALGEAMAANGPWLLIGQALPAPRLSATFVADRSVETPFAVAADRVPVPEARPDTSSTLLAMNVPLPMTAPR
jgi:hypothetical protein